MGGLHKFMLCVLIVIFGLSFAHGYDSRTSRKFDSLERKMEIITMELLDVKADLRVEKSKSITLENKLNVLMDDKKVNAYDDKDSDLTEHHSVVHNQQEVGSVAISVEQRIYDAMKDEKNVRKQFEKQMKTDLMTANKHTEMKFITLKETLSAAIDNKLDTIEDKVHASVAGLNEASSSMTNLTIQVQHNDDAITSLMLESDQLNTTLLRYGTKLETIKVDLANKVEELIDNSHRYKVRCFNGAKHSEDGTCECTMPYYGTHCEKGCFNDGKYLEDGSCECSRLYVGAKCEKVRCFNGANYSEDGTCECTIPYYGTHCEKGCFNDGKYLEDGSCECSRLYVGAKCEKVRCFNGANYSEDGTCECTIPYYGTHCEKGCFNDGKYLEDGSCECSRLYVGAKCEKVRCFNGANYSEDGTCECTIPYYGTHCEKGCFNDGKYLEDGSCECSRLYVGAKCEKVRCFNGANYSEDGTCECTIPYYGTHCEKGCSNDGKYLEDGSCECSRLYVGAKCEKVRCFNGANYSEDGTCECTIPYYGTHCEKGCFNDGKYLEDGSCECSRLYDGAKCEKVRCFNGAKHSEDGTCECTMPYYDTHCEKECSEIRESKLHNVYMDCYDIHKHTDKATGIYTVAPRGSNENIEIKCDMDIDGGGWTVFQYRHDGSVDFYKKFDEYEKGFGSLNGEFWLGLQYIHVMTSSVPSVLRIDVEAADGTTAYQTYDDFNISEGPDYRLNVGATSGTAGDGGYGSLSNNNGRPFSTYDHDRDGYREGNCADFLHGAWWYKRCHGYVNLNGEYPTPGTTSTIENGYGGMIYYMFKNTESLKTSQIMFRRT